MRLFFFSNTFDFVIILILIQASEYRTVLSHDINNNQTTRLQLSVDKFTIPQLYDDAFLSYLEEDFEHCVELFEVTRKRYKIYKTEISNCRRKCKNKVKQSPTIFNHFAGDIAFYEAKIKETLCLLHCVRDYELLHGKGTLSLLPPKVETKFAELNDYAFAHICYFQMGRYEDAANAVYTHLIRNPEDKMSLNAIKHYLTNPIIKKDMVRDLESPAFVEKYRSAVKFYEEENYLVAIEDFEDSLRLYLLEDDECRLYCEGPFDQGWNPEFVVVIANHYTYTLQCKQNCTKWLSTINGEHQKDILANHYHYLQFAYYKVGQINNACRAVASYLLFNPADETMLENKNYYAAMPKIKQEHFKPRQEAIDYVKRQTAELSLLRFISEEFQTQLKDDVKIDEIVTKNTKNINKELTNETYDTENNVINSSILNQIKITAKEQELHGTMRYVAEGFLSKMECDMLVKMAQIAVIEGDGYKNNRSPHSKFEKFEGATIGRIALLTYLGILDTKPVELLLKVTENVRDHVKKYFNITDPLYFTFTHLTKRSSLVGSPVNRQDLSHKVHADNCIISKGICYRNYPAYTWREYSAILYLNQEFIGGEFVFTKDLSAKKIDASIQPRCGRAVAFSADERNLHGVRAISSGHRYVIAFWFTRDSKYLEIERILARAVIQKIHHNGLCQIHKPKSIPLSHEEMLTNIFYNDTNLRLYLYDW